MGTDLLQELLDSLPPDHHERAGVIRAIELLRAEGYVVLPNQPDHIVEFRDDGWQVMHSIQCRMEGKLLDCDVHVAIDNDADWPGLGRFKVHLDNGWPVYEKVD